MPSPAFNGLGQAIHNVFKENQSAVFKPQIGSNESVEVIFHARHQETDRDGVPYGAERPVAWILTAAGIDPKYDDGLEINGVDYIIKEIKPDGLEIVELILAEL